MAKIGYARVSTEEQNLDPQTDQLTAAGCDRVFADKASGKLASRPEFDQALDYMRAGDVLVVTKLDRVGRSVGHLVSLMERLDDAGVGLQVLQQAIDTTTPGGRLVFHIFAALAEFERELIRERTLDGLAAARARGRRGGRPSALSERQETLALQMYDSGEHSLQAIADTVGSSRATIYRRLNRREAAAS
jgi:DNA invertase Pin-like site-specific DNA recombinase